MRSIHLSDAHTIQGPNVFAFSVSVVVWCGMALFFFLVSWAVGGEDFKNSLGGNTSMVILLLGIVIGAVLAAYTRPRPEQ